MTVKTRKHIFRWLLLILLLGCAVVLASVFMVGEKTKPATAASVSATAKPAAAAHAKTAGATWPQVSVDCLAAADPQACIAESSKANGLGKLALKAAQTTLPVPLQSLDCSKASNPAACLGQQQVTGKTKQPTQAPTAAPVNPTTTEPASNNTAASVPNSKASNTNTNTSVADALNAKTTTVAKSPTVSSTDKTNTQRAAAEKACQMAPNPDECLRKLTNQFGTPVNFNPGNYPLTSDLLGLSGPLSFVLRYDEDLSVILGVDYVQMFNESFGVSGKFTLGSKERRANLTTGFALTPDQQFKVTYEYLTQNLNFNFASGSVQQWVDQHAIGGAYQYLLRYEILHSFEISGYTVRANSKDLSSLAFNQVGDTYDVNLRRIAGGTENTVEAALNLLPLKNTALTVGAGYSAISYDTQYEANPSASGLAYKFKIEHVLTPKTKLSGGVNAAASGREHNIGVSHILPHNIEVSVKAQYLKGEAGLSNSKNVALGFTYPAPQSYSLGGFTNGMQELRNWIEKPVVYKTRVLAIKDEMIQSYSLVASDLGEQTIYLNLPDREITPVSTVGNFVFNDPELNVTFTAAIACPSTDSGCGLSTLHLQLDTSVPNQATLVSTANVDANNPVTTAGPYVITITGTGTRAGLAQPLVASADFRLNVVGDAPTWITTSGTLQFDTTPDIQAAVAGSRTAGGIQLQLSIPAASDVTFALNPSQPPALPNWTVEADSSNNWFLMRNVDGNGNLNASDIGTSPTVHLCAYVANSPCIAGAVVINNPSPLSADTATNPSTGKSVIGGNVPTAFSTGSGSDFTGWDTTANGLTSFYALPNASPIPIIGDAFSSWVVGSASIPAWTSPATISITSGGVMSGTAQVTSSTQTYDGIFDVKTKSAGGSGGTTVGSTFKASVTAAAAPTVQNINGTIRFDLTNGTQDGATGGLTPQPSDYSGGRTLIDLTTMVTNIGSGSKQVPLASLKFSFDSAGNVTQQGNWQILAYGGAGSTAGHTYLFRSLNSSNHLDAGDVGNSPDVTICVANVDSASPANCSRIVNASVTADTLTRSSDSRQYVRVQIPEYFNGTFSFDTNSGSAIPDGQGAAYWNILGRLQSVFLGQTLTTSTPILIDNDVRTTVSGSLIKDSAWTTAYAVDGAGNLTGTAPSVLTIPTSYDSSFTARSKAAGGLSFPITLVRFLTAVFPVGAPVPDFEPTASTIRFDMINDSSDPGLKPATSADVIDLTTMVVNGIAPDKLQFCFNNDPTGATCTIASDNWQLLKATSTEVSAWGATLDHTYLLRRVNSSGNLEAGDITQTTPSEVTLFVKNTTSGVAPYPTTSGMVPVTVAGDSVNTIKGNISNLYAAQSGNNTFQWNTTNQIIMSYYDGVSTLPLFTIDNDSIPPVVGAVTMTPSWSTPLNIAASGIMTGTAPTVIADSAYSGIFQVTSKSAAARNVPVNFNAEILSTSLFTDCASAGDNCQMKFDTIDITTIPGSNDAINLTTRLNTAYGYTNPTFTVTGTAANNWTAVQVGTGPSSTWYLLRKTTISPSIDASQVGLAVSVSINVSESGKETKSGVLVVTVAPDPALIYTYIGANPFNIRVIDDPDSTQNYVNVAQPGSINFSATTQAFTQPRTGTSTSLACPDQTQGGQKVGCKVINDSSYTFGFVGGTPPSYAKASGSTITFTYGNLTKANWRSILTDFNPTAMSTANGNAASPILSPPEIRAYDLEIVPRRMDPPVPFLASPGMYNCPDPMPNGTNECLIPSGNPASNWQPVAILNIDLLNTSLTQSQLKIVQYKATYPAGAGTQARKFCKGKINNTQSSDDATNRSWQANCFGTGMTTNPYPNTLAPLAFPQAPINGFVAFAADYVLKSGGSNIPTTYPDYLDAAPSNNQHLTNIVIRYKP